MYRKKIGFIYFGGLYQEEEKIVSSKFPTYRTKTLSEISSKPHEIFSCGYIIPRGIKLSQSDYKESFDILSANGLHLISTPKSYEISNSVKESSSILGSNMPKTFIFDAKLSDLEILNTLKDSMLSLLFVRSEKESAAKYVGVDGCIAYDKSTLLLAIKNLRENVKGFSDIIFKEVVPIEECISSKKKLEYRIIVVNGDVVSFDYDESLPSPKSCGLDKYAITLVNEIEKKGFSGAYFMDLGVKKDGGFFIIENKNIINGYIKDINNFIKKLLDKSNSMYL